ncbi:hypothetical protein INT43_001624, partial [Umbelopsis isabellina]
MSGLLYIPTKRRYHYRDPFFSEGDIAIRAAWLQKQDSQLEEYWHSVQEEAIDTQRQSIHCELSTCKGHVKTTFPTLAAYELHYDMWHRYICEECHKSFPGEQWLELHFDEFHNVIKRIAKDRGENIYKCYVPGCPKMFSTPKMRRLHLIDKHHYSRLYPFDLPFTGNLSFKERQKRVTVAKQVLEAKKAGASMKDISSLAIDKPEKMDFEKQANDADNLDKDMEDIIHGISKLKVPKSISFGRAPRGLYNHAASHKHHRHKKPHDHQMVEANHDHVAEAAKPATSQPNRRNRNRKRAKENRRTNGTT